MRLTKFAVGVCRGWAIIMGWFAISMGWFAIIMGRFAIAVSIPRGKVTIDKIMNNLIFMEIKTIDYSYILYKKFPVIKTRELLN